MTCWMKQPETHRVTLTPGQQGSCHFSLDVLHLEVTARGADVEVPYTLTNETTGSIAPALPTPAQNTSSPSTGFAANALAVLADGATSNPISSGNRFRWFTFINTHATATLVFDVVAGDMAKVPVIAMS